MALYDAVVVCTDGELNERVHWRGMADIKSDAERARFIVQTLLPLAVRLADDNAYLPRHVLQEEKVEMVKDGVVIATLTMRFTDKRPMPPVGIN